MIVAHTEVCVKHHKTAPVIVILPQDAEKRRMAKRANRRAR